MDAGFSIIGGAIKDTAKWTADLSIRQSEIFPQIESGDSIPRGEVAEAFGLIPGVPLREQGYPKGIPIEVVNLPGAKK